MNLLWFNREPSIHVLIPTAPTIALTESFLAFPDYEITLYFAGQRVCRMLFSYHTAENLWHVTLLMNPKKFETTAFQTHSVTDGFTWCEDVFISRISEKKRPASRKMFQKSQQWFIPLVEALLHKK